MANGQAEVSPLQFLQLIADPLRWRLLGELAHSDRRVVELCEIVSKPQSLVSYHVRELRTAGLVSARHSSADRRDTYYRADVGRCVESVRAVGTRMHPAIRLAYLPVEPTSGPRSRRVRVLFLCTGNSARSQMAEALIEHRSQHTITARSAGSDPKPLHPNAVRVMAERGIDISEQTSKHLSRFARSRFDRVITLCDKVKEVCPEFPGQPVTAHWSMADPAADGEGDTSYPAFVRTADEIDERVALLIGWLATVAQGGKERP